jgi:transaldolase
MVNANPLRRLAALGQSVWLDYIGRGFIAGGELARLIAEDGLSGITSNPAIFEKAISQGDEYGAAIAKLAPHGRSPAETYLSLVLEDIGRAADEFRPLYDGAGGGDGYVSIEVSPHLAYDTDGTVAEGERLWKALGRPNVMIKVPATREGLPAVRRLTSAGINVNVTLLFSVARYREVADAYMAGLEERLAAGQPIAGLASVASFFLSRIDTLVDARLDALGTPAASQLRGRSAIACARLAYVAFKEIGSEARWQRLAGKEARLQRLLWASTSAKDPAYGALKYVEPLVGRHTVSTFTPDTLAAYRAAGDPALRIEDALVSAHAVPKALAGLGIDLNEVAERLEAEGVRKFVEPYDKLLAALERRR